VLTVPFRLGNTQYEREYRDMLLNTINITTEPVSLAIAEQAAHLRVTAPIRLSKSYFLLNSMNNKFALADSVCEDDNRHGLFQIREIIQLMSLNLAALLPSVIDIAQQAGAIIMRHYAAPITALAKSNRIDLVTAADKEAEIYIVAALKALCPTHHIVGEEGGGQGVALADAEYLWFVDPVDGTTNFASKLPQFCTSIALTDKTRQPLLAVIYDPVKRELFTAIKGGGTWMNGRPVRVTETTELLDSVMASGFPTDRVTNPDNNLREWAAIVPLLRGERRLGSAALDLAYVAAGRLDGFWEAGLNPWDVAAGVLLVEEAGGCVTDYEGQPMPQRQDKSRYVATNGKIHAAFLEALAAVRGSK